MTISDSAAKGSRRKRAVWDKAAATGRVPGGAQDGTDSCAVEVVTAQSAY